MRSCKDGRGNIVISLYSKTQPDPTGRNAGTATGHLSENREHMDHAATHSGQSQRLNLPHGRMDPLISRRQRLGSCPHHYLQF